MYPHILPTIYDKQRFQHQSRSLSLQKELISAGIPLRLVSGADVHFAPNLVEGLENGRVLTLNNSRYLLLEPPHYAPLPQLEKYVFKLHALGYVAILTHPERLSWVETQYRLIKHTVHNGVWVQLTAGSLTGCDKFYRLVKY
jgi:protein-tyrosine phosphatase